MVSMSLRKDNPKLYFHIHDWLKNNFTRPNECENCGATGKILDWANISGDYIKTRG